MKTITIKIPPELDAAAADEAKRLGISKSELLRRGLEALLPTDTVDALDPWAALAGFVDQDLDIQPGDIDKVVYGL